MSKHNFRVYLKDILSSSEKILRYTQGKSIEDFRSDEMLTDAVVRNLEIIGEAVKGIPIGIKRKYSEMEWKKIAGLKDIIIHEYFRIDYEIIWDIVSNKIPLLGLK
jgi:uncharacterized protein with HEPN domain